MTLWNCRCRSSLLKVCDFVAAAVVAELWWQTRASVVVEAVVLLLVIRGEKRENLLIDFYLNLFLLIAYD